MNYVDQLAAVLTGAAHAGLPSTTLPPVAMAWRGPSLSPSNSPDQPQIPRLPETLPHLAPTHHIFLFSLVHPASPASFAQRHCPASILALLSPASLPCSWPRPLGSENRPLIPSPSPSPWSESRSTCPTAWGASPTGRVIGRPCPLTPAVSLPSEVKGSVHPLCPPSVYLTPVSDPFSLPPPFPTSELLPLPKARPRPLPTRLLPPSPSNWAVTSSQGASTFHQKSSKN